MNKRGKDTAEEHARHNRSNSIKILSGQEAINGGMIEVTFERKMSNSEKITINLGAVDLGKIDLLVQEGHYSNRTDFIRTAIRTQTERHTLEVQQSVSRHHYGLGLFEYTRADLEQYKAKGERMNFSVVGMLKLAADIPPDLAAEVIESVRVRGVFQAGEAVKAILAGRMK
jgi:Arc/MetJ-type ribon-helix-helix transcriptional regulator